MDSSRAIRHRARQMRVVLTGNQQATQKSRRVRPQASSSRRPLARVSAFTLESLLRGSPRVRLRRRKNLSLADTIPEQNVFCNLYLRLTHYFKRCSAMAERPRPNRSLEDAQAASPPWRRIRRPSAALAGRACFVQRIEGARHSLEGHWPFEQVTSLLEPTRRDPPRHFLPSLSGSVGHVVTGAHHMGSGPLGNA